MRRTPRRGATDPDWRGSRRQAAVLTLAVVLAAELLALLPSLTQTRTIWLQRQIAAASPAPAATPMPASPIPKSPAPALDLDRESFLAGMARTLLALAGANDRALAVEADGWPRAGATVTAQLDGAALGRALRSQAVQFLVASLPVLGIAALLLFVALRACLAAPLRRLGAGLAALQATPDRPIALPPPFRLPPDPESETLVELEAIRRALREAQWREARLAALAAAVGKANHDLRGALSPALLTAERLQMNSDPAIKRGADVLVRAVERAADVMRKVVEQAREYPIGPGKERLLLRAVMEQAAEQARTACPALAVENAAPDDVTLEADSDALLRAIGTLLQNAGLAGARRVRIAATVEGHDLMITVSDDAAGLPDPVAAAPFRAVTGPGGGVGLAIVRELMRAQGGDAVLLQTGADGTSFRLTLPAARPAPAAVRQAAAGD